MHKNLSWKIILIGFLLVAGSWALYPPNKTLKQGIDLAGGTSLIYEINTQGLSEEDKRGLSEKMITVLRRRTDPAGIQNLIWHPLGSSRFEIRMPLASAEAGEKREDYEKARNALLGENVSRAVVMRTLQKPAEERAKKFNDFAGGDPNKLAILDKLAKVYDERKELQDKRDELDGKLKTTEEQITSAELDLDLVKLRRSDWAKLSEQELLESLREFTGVDDVNEVGDVNDANGVTDVNEVGDVNDANGVTDVNEVGDVNDANGVTDVNEVGDVNDANDVTDVNDVNDVAGVNEAGDANAVDVIDPNVELLSGYVKTYGEWVEAVNQITDPEKGKNVQYADAKKEIDGLNLTEDHLDRCLDLAAKSADRREAIQELKTKFPDREAQIDQVLEAFEEYRPFRGRLDDPKDLQRMLKGAGILEFRVLPTRGGESDPELIDGYIESLKKNGPKYTSEKYDPQKRYVWCEIEGPGELWRAADAQERPSIVGQFGDKSYVLASNKKGEVILQSSAERQWKMDRAGQGQDQYGRRAISFTLDIRGGNLFSKVTRENIDRPLCILLDAIAVSAPNIQSEVGRQGIITGRFTETEQKDMIDKLNAGSLPAMLIEQPISVNTIGPSIGADNRDKGIRAGLIGLAVVMACMLGYYLLAGSIADVALVMNILFVLAIMAAVQATFTLPGIAGIILTIGMSVDANVLIFERIREEQQKGSSLRIAITNGYQRAFRTIFDANLTTFITAAILYWVASEEIKGFAIVLMLGIASSMFTALFVTRVIFDLLLSRRIIKDHLFMLRLIHKPNVNWMRLRPVFFCISILLIAGGAFVFFTRQDKYDIEFTGGTSVQTNFKDGVMLTRQEVEDRIHSVLASVNVYSIGKPIGLAPNGERIYKQYQIDTGETNKITVAVAFPDAEQHTADELAGAIRKTQNQGRFSAVLTNLTVTQDANDTSKFIVTTSQMNQVLVTEVLTTAFATATVSEPQVHETVNDAVLETFRGELKGQEDLRPKITSEEKISQELIDSYPELADFIGGVKLACEVEMPVTVEEIHQRLNALRFKPDTQDLERYEYRILGSDLNPIADPNAEVQSFVYVSVEEEAGLRELLDEERTEEWTRFVDNEKSKVLAAGQLATSLPRVRQFDPSVGSEAKQRALIAIVLSLFAIVTYIWVRFGNVRYGIAAITALVHDVAITLGAVTACTYIAASPIGEKLLIGDFKINLAMIAAFLTLIGYSLNDTIVVFDRIRENRGKRLLNPQVITNSINQTISRTILTSFTTFIVVLIMYIFGGQGLRGFTFAIGFGIIVGTYSSIAIAAPILLLGAKTQTEKKAKKRP